MGARGEHCHVTPWGPPAHVLAITPSRALPHLSFPARSNPAAPTHVLRVPDVISSVTSTMQICPLTDDFQES